MIKLLKSKKALSPVVAAIILIAVTVAVSIAVAAWMGSMTFTFMETEQLTITNMAFGGTGNTQIILTVINTGTTEMTLSTATVAGTGAGTVSTIAPTAITDGTSSQTVTLTLSGTWTAGNPYTVELVTSKGNRFSYTAVA